MADSKVDWRVIVWTVCGWLSIMAAVLTAFQGKIECFLWTFAAAIEWHIAQKLSQPDEEKGNEDDDGEF